MRGRPPTFERPGEGMTPFLAKQFLRSAPIALALCLTAAASQAQPVAKDARLSGDETRTRFIVDLSKDLKEDEIGVRALADPYRVVVDLPEIEINLPQGLGREGHGLVSAYRYGKFKTFGVRIVLDVRAPVLVEKLTAQPSQHGQPARLVLVLARTDPATFQARLKESRRNRQSEAQPAPAGKHGLAKSPRKDSDKPLVVIDPGHGGIDPGARSASGMVEKDVVLEFGKVLRDKLIATKRYQVALTREDDTFVALGDRVETARAKGGDLFISIHADSVPGRFARLVSGATIYTLSEQASDAEARALAAKENRSDIIAGVDLPPESDEVAGILIDLAQRETKNLSISFAETVLASLSSDTLVGKKPHRYAGFRVLKAPDVPSVLLELGYLTHPEDEKQLKSDAWREKVVSGLVKAVDGYFSKRVARIPF